MAVSYTHLTAQKIVYTALDKVAEATGEESIEVFYKALNNVMPVLEVQARRIGGATYQVPMEVRPERRQTLGLRWLVGFARKRGESTMADRLAKEILDASNGLGGSVKRKEEMHRTAAVSYTHLDVYKRQTGKDTTTKTLC